MKYILDQQELNNLVPRIDLELLEKQGNKLKTAAFHAREYIIHKEGIVCYHQSCRQCPIDHHFGVFDKQDSILLCTKHRHYPEDTKPIETNNRGGKDD